MKQVQKLTGPPAVVDFRALFPASAEIARGLLVKQRIHESGYRELETQLRDIFRSKKKKEAARNGSSWIFTKVEVAKAFQNLICSSPLLPPGVAQALLAHASQTSIDELWLCLSSLKVEEREKSRISLSHSPHPKLCGQDIATCQDNVNYVRLLCQAQMGQDALNRSFVIALSRYNLAVLRLLLSFGAVASDCQEAIREIVHLDDFAVAKLLLSAPPGAMSPNAWRYCVEPEIIEMRAPNLLLQCLANRHDVACGSLLLKALLCQNFQPIAIIPVYAGSEEDLLPTRERACELAFTVEDDEKRLKFLIMLSHVGFIEDELVVRQHSVKEVKAKSIAPIKILVAVGVSVDISPNNALPSAISMLEFDIIEILISGNISPPLSPLLKHTPGDISEADLIRLLSVFSPIQPLVGETLDWHLARAVQRSEQRLIRNLVKLGASIEFEKRSLCEMQ